ncbi:hypothetical protein roselon_03158 [Roseibacterium elongatum DSM 19469]|uniref:Uncharacterized protein n=1 Tax=Roseicyclus elongatus DSM 19469 TaxID=1294273 RepID=W8SSF7_9RHOB|nr:hypothetical protein [Roseibacterium elongatum]AHM05425.1 hypothetical protein roselon_03158 [Roseibacterium elongatum DSM 19469]
MPSLSALAARYLVWIVALRFVYAALISFAGIPNSLATGVILASVPAADVGMRAARSATRGLGLRDWGVIWAMMLGLYLLLNVVLPALLMPAIRAMLGDPAGLSNQAMLVGSTALMLALFLWIGRRAAGADAPGNRNG